jgi:tetratricopeptide (TPR) repeat protein
MTDMATDEYVGALFRRAEVYQSLQQSLEAAVLCRQILERDPAHGRAVKMLVMVFISLGDYAEAERVLLDHLKVCPNGGASQQGLGQLKAKQGDDEAAVIHFQRAIRELPDHAPLFNDLGVSLHRLGRLDEALAALDRAIELNEKFSLAHANRGKLLFERGRFDEALHAQFVALIATDSASASARAVIIEGIVESAQKGNRLELVEQVVRSEVQTNYSVTVAKQLAIVLDQLGREEEAEVVRNEAAQCRNNSLAARTGQAKATILLIGIEGCNHTPTQYLIDTQIFNKMAVSLAKLNGATAPFATINGQVANRADIAFNLLSDADRDDDQLAIANSVCKKLARPLLNPPNAILKTSRDQAAELFAGIEGMITPASIRISAADFREYPIDAPILVRPPGDHGGEKLALLSNEVEKHAFLSSNSATQLVLTPFYNFQSADGHWRKYRLIFVDRKVYPYHLAIGDEWLVHYWRAEMARSNWKKNEEARFLADWRDVLGGVAADAVEEAARRLDLDYCGMDCALMPDGRLLLFEANATMLIHLCEPPAAFPYKHQYVPLIREAFTALVLKRVRESAEMKAA